MIDPNCPARRVAVATFGTLPRPAVAQASSDISAKTGFALPRTTTQPANIADSGRIRFGAGFRLRSTI